MNSLPYTSPSQSHVLLRQILLTTREAVVAESQEGAVVAVNQQFLDLVGWTKPYAGGPLDDLLAHWRSHTPFPENFEDYFKLCRLGSASPAPTELHPDEGPLVGARFVSVTGPVSFRLWFFQERLSTSLAWISHEVKNPLNAILGFSELLAEKLKNDEVSAPLLKGLAIGAKQLQSVLGDILEPSQGEPGAVPEWVNLSLLLGEIDALFRTRCVRRGLELVIDAPGDAPDLWLDGARVSQILGNLLSNALRFTKRGWVALRVRHTEDRWDFVVEDSGVGIAPETQKSLFGPLGRSAPGAGPGFGLAICRRLAHNLGAELSLESEPGHGSRFTLSFPTLKSRVQEPSVSGLTLLVADDERTNHLVVQGFLRGYSVNVAPASDGFQAVEQWKKLRPQVVLMDLRMPGLSGLEAARRIRALDPEASTKLFAMSATKLSPAETTEGRGLWSGFLEKPFSKKEILNFLSKHLTMIDDSAKSS